MVVWVNDAFTLFSLSPSPRGTLQLSMTNLFSLTYSYQTALNFFFTCTSEHPRPSSTIFFFSLSPSSCYQHLSLDSKAEVCDKNNLNPTVEIESYFLVPRIHFSEVYCEHRDPDEYRASPELNTATGTGTWSASLMNLLRHM